MNKDISLLHAQFISDNYPEQHKLLKSEKKKKKKTFTLLLKNDDHSEKQQRKTKPAHTYTHTTASSTLFFGL